MKGNSSCDSSPNNNQSERRDSHKGWFMCYMDSSKNWLIGSDGVGEHEERDDCRSHKELQILNFRAQKELQILNFRFFLRRLEKPKIN